MERGGFLIPQRAQVVINRRHVARLRSSGSRTIVGHAFRFRGIDGARSDQSLQ
jgi:hypothetical protein